MPIPNFSGETFVAFMDISGFKSMMKKKDRARWVMNKFYSVCYEILSTKPRIHGLFISDCGILFNAGQDKANEKLKAILETIEAINRQLLEEEIMLTTSIAFGTFQFEEKIELPWIDKNLIYGNAYLLAFLDNEKLKKPGYCRILKENLVTNEFAEDDIRKLDRIKEDKRHWYYYWMVNEQSEIKHFEIEYERIEEEKYSRMINALRSSFIRQK